MSGKTSQPGPRLTSPRGTADIVRRLAQGKLDAVAEVTLTAGASSTVVSDGAAAFATEDSVILASPRSAHAAGELATMWFEPANGSFTIHHANNAQTDRTFGYAVLG